MSRSRPVALWLLVVCGLVFLMVVVGGMTRLTNSGLSIVHWKPVTGILPPLSVGDWQELFDAYRQSPEYLKINRGMTLEEFKSIFWLEYLHRLLGRLIGFAFLLPLVWFWIRGYVGRALLPRLVLFFVLGGLQGALGWYMVKSGLVDNPAVSQYRLAAHLSMAILIYGAMLWTALDLLAEGRPRSVPAPRGVCRHAAAAFAMTCLTIVAGAFVAGLDAGFTYNTFPLMDGQWVPDGLFPMDPWWLSVFEDITTVQFQHRWLAVATLVVLLALWWRGRAVAPTGRQRGALGAVAAIGLLQAGLGVGTLVMVVPVWLGTLHQAGALALFTALLVALHALRGHSHVY